MPLGAELHPTRASAKTPKSDEKNTFTDSFIKYTTNLLTRQIRLCSDFATIHKQAVCAPSPDFRRRHFLRNWRPHLHELRICRGTYMLIAVDPQRPE